MKVYAYGEDALTLWAIKSKLPEILKQLNGGKDEAEEVVKDCKIFFRPSFGRGKTMVNSILLYLQTISFI